jgi:hypothetical protein
LEGAEKKNRQRGTSEEEDGSKSANILDLRSGVAAPASSGEEATNGMDHRGCQVAWGCAVATDLCALHGRSGAQGQEPKNV